MVCDKLHFLRHRAGIIGLVLMAVAAPVIADNGGEAESRAGEILKKVRDRDDGDSYATDVSLELVADDGDTRVRDLYILQKDLSGGEERSLMYFYQPSDVRNVSLLVATYPESDGKADDQWMYLPAFRRTRRIGSNDKRGAFMGSEFNYSDLDKIRLSDYQSTLVGEEEVLGRPAWKIERHPRSQDVINKTGYHSVTVWVDKERDIILQQEYYDAKNVKFKVQQAAEVEEVQGIWTITKAVMSNLEDGKSSAMIFKDIVYNIDISDSQFAMNALRRPVRSSQLPFNNSQQSGE